MEHTEAVQLKAAERYVLGELSGDLRAQYEDHYFGCVECAQDLKLAAMFAQNTRAVLEADAATAQWAAPAAAARRPASSGWFGAFLRPSFAVPVFALLLLFAGYQDLIVIPHLKSAVPSAAPQTLPSYSLITADSRGGEPPAITVAANRPFGLYIDIPPEKQFPHYVCEVVNASGAQEYSLNISGQEAQNSVQLLMPPATLKAGNYTLVVRGLGTPESAASKGTEVARYPFTLAYSK
jgi:Putative zinc-finger